LLGTLKDR